MERVLDSLDSLPALLIEQQITGVHRMDKSKEPGNPSTSNYGDIVLYDNAFGQDRVLARILSHELAHRVFSALTKADQRSYYSAAGWRQVGKGAMAQLRPGRPSKSFVTEDGMKSPEEDFANNIETFIFDPVWLESKTPNVYSWIQQNYGSSLKLVRRSQ